jgi:hypothetical protein
MGYVGGMGYHHRANLKNAAAATVFSGATSRDKQYVVIVNKPKSLELSIDNDGNYINIKRDYPNPYNIINNSKLISYKHGSNNEVQLEKLTGDDLKTAFAPVKQHILAIDPNDSSTYVTLTFKSNKDHIPLYPYSVTLTSSLPIGIKRTKGTDINDNDVTIMTIGETSNPYGITSGSRLVGIMYNRSELTDITYADDAEDFKYFVAEKNKIDPDDNNTYITLYIVSTDPKAPQKAAAASAAAASAARAAERGATETLPTISGGKSRKAKRHHKTKRHRYRKKSRRKKSRRSKSRRSKSRRRNKH